MANKKILIFIRYLSIIFIIATISINNKIDIYGVGFILVYIINNQLRFFTYNNKKSFIVISILIEWIVAYFTFSNYGGMMFFYFLPSILDSAFLIDGGISYTVSLLGVIAMLVCGKSLFTNETLLSTFSLMTLLALSNYIKEEVKGKRRAQDLYDKLRLSENELKKAKEDLEIYANSIEELTLLRERNRISREIHDSVGHSLSTAIIQLGAIEKMAKQNREVASSLAKNLGEFMKNSLQEVREAVRALKPREFEKYEGILAIEELAKNFQKLTGVLVKLRYSKQNGSLNSDHSFVIYRVAQEFMSNSLRHGKATEINIFMSFNEDNLIITLRDNGIGAEKIERGIGLQSIWERVSELGGQISYNTSKGQGFLLKVILYPYENLVKENKNE